MYFFLSIYNCGVYYFIHLLHFFISNKYFPAYEIRTHNEFKHFFPRTFVDVTNMPRVLIHTNLKDGDIPDDFDDKVARKVSDVLQYPLEVHVIYSYEKSLKISMR